jgi:ATP synthase protein I
MNPTTPPDLPEDGGRAGRKDAGLPRTDRDGPSIGSYAGHGLTFAISIIVFLYLGQWLDRRLGTGPWLMMLLMFVGAGAAFYSMYRKLMAAQERDEAERKARREQGR